MAYQRHEMSVMLFSEKDAVFADETFDSTDTTLDDPIGQNTDDDENGDW